MASPLRLGLALLALLFALVVTAVALRTDDERERFLGQPCREVEEEKVSTARLLTPASGEAVATSPTPLAAPERALGGEPVMSGPEADLAKQYEPVLNVAKLDRFWPVPVPTVLDLNLGERFTSFVSRAGRSPHARLSDLRPNGGARQYLDYPAQVDHVEDEFCSLGHALHIPATDLAQWRYNPDLLQPARFAQFYFFDRPVGRRGRDLQYWFFYPLNYLPELTNDFIFLTDPIAAIAANADFHEGDFEHVTVQLRPQGGALVPTAVEMARHKGEDKPLAWDSPKLQLLGSHPIVYSGFGGHASYNKCGPQVRRALGFIPLIDWTLCGDEQNFVFGPETPLVNLRSVRWSCWPGHFGELPPHPIPELLVEGPRGPFFQDDKDLRDKLCAAH